MIKPKPSFKEIFHLHWGHILEINFILYLKTSVKVLPETSEEKRCLRDNHRIKVYQNYWKFWYFFLSPHIKVGVIFIKRQAICRKT